MNRCKNCYWNLSKDQDTNDVICVHEDELIHQHETQYQYNCIGYLGEDFERDFWNQYEQLNNEIKHLNLMEIRKVRTFIEDVRKESV